MTVAIYFLSSLVREKGYACCVRTLVLGVSDSVVVDLSNGFVIRGINIIPITYRLSAEKLLTESSCSHGATLVIFVLDGTSREQWRQFGGCGTKTIR